MNLPIAIRQPLVDTATLLAPLLAAGFLKADGSMNETQLSRHTCLADPDVVRNRITYRSAVYVAWDRLGQCRYVGSVHRAGTGAVGNRLYEHYQHRTKGDQRRSAWALLSALPIWEEATEIIVRKAEGWAARGLMPLEGAAHPVVELGDPPRVLARLIQT